MSIQALKQLIQSVPNWQSLTPGELLSKLKEPTIQFVNPESYTLLGIAKIIGKEKMQPLEQFLVSIGADWVMRQAVSGLPIGDPELNAEIASIPHPDCQAIAHAGRRMISVLDQAGLSATLQDVTDAQAKLLFDNRKQQLIEQNAVRWNAFCAAVDSWDGTTPEPEL